MHLANSLSCFSVAYNRKENFVLSMKFSFFSNTFFLFLILFANLSASDNYTYCGVCDTAKIRILKQITTKEQYE